MASTIDVFVRTPRSDECRAGIKDLIESEIAAIFIIEVQKATREFKQISRLSRKRRETQLCGSLSFSGKMAT